MGTISEKQRQEVLSRGGRLPMAEVLRCKVRYFADGAVIGSRSFVDSLFKRQRRRFGARRRNGARRARGVGSPEDGTALFSLRDLRKEVFGTPPK